MDIVPFKMEILQYRPDGTFIVRYTPEDPDCQEVELGPHIDISDTAASTREEIINRLASAAPQFMWQQQKLAKTMDMSLRESLVGAVEDNAHVLVEQQMNQVQEPIQQVMIPRIDVPIVTR